MSIAGGWAGGWISGTAVGGGATILARGSARRGAAAGFAGPAKPCRAAGLTAASRAAGGLAARGLLATRCAGVAAARFGAVVFAASLRAVTAREAGFFTAAIVRAVDFRVAVTASLARDTAVARTARFAGLVAFTADFAFAARTGAFLAAWALLSVRFTRPFMAAPNFRAFAATVGRRVGLLCWVDAMGTTLVTVEAW
jgi:hypothetical protein